MPVVSSCRATRRTRIPHGARRRIGGCVCSRLSTTVPVLSSTPTTDNCVTGNATLTVGVHSTLCCTSCRHTGRTTGTVVSLKRCRLSPDFRGVFVIDKRGSGRVVTTIRRSRGLCSG